MIFQDFDPCLDLDKTKVILFKQEELKCIEQAKDEVSMIEHLPPKTCTIDRLITQKTDIDRVLSGQKLATRRNGRYADPGEVLKLQGQKFEVYRVYQQSLGDMQDHDAKQEGFSNLQAYKDYILSLHPKMRWIPQAKVWVHEFRPLT
ncbi:hypothetical protein SAMN05444392_101180 [Seinonella peptonophila]|uniref:ASCH domain-containing protein n=2 Tax=Seinonella peptonophila TaxID=112248 RepID=A0A1M4SWP2_9BACL|nr:hypothetical protein SAMN05444392_101180 [Seinonella peptonophila]